MVSSGSRSSMMIFMVICSKIQHRSGGPSGMGVDVLVGAGGTVKVGVLSGGSGGVLFEHPPGRHQQAVAMMATVMIKGRSLIWFLIGFSSLEKYYTG
jgi:hypothetical protein